MNRAYSCAPRWGWTANIFRPRNGSTARSTQQVPLRWSCEYSRRTPEPGRIGISAACPSRGWQGRSSKHTTGRFAWNPRWYTWVSSILAGYSPIMSPMHHCWRCHGLRSFLVSDESFVRDRFHLRQLDHPIRQQLQRPPATPLRRARAGQHRQHRLLPRTRFLGLTAPGPLR